MDLNYSIKLYFYMGIRPYYDLDGFIYNYFYKQSSLLATVWFLWAEAHGLMGYTPSYHTNYRV